MPIDSNSQRAFGQVSEKLMQKMVLKCETLTDYRMPIDSNSQRAFGQVSEKLMQKMVLDQEFK